MLQRPLANITSHWDEWYHHEASSADRAAIDEIGKRDDAQREFAQWLLQDWSAEALSNGNRVAPSFMVREIAHCAPFDRWSSWSDFRVAVESNGISAIVLEDENHGTAGDIRRVEAILLPAEPPCAGSTIVSQDFQVDISELNSARQAVIKTLEGAGLLRLLLLWLAIGKRAYPRWLGVFLGLGWGAVAALIAFLRFGSEPGAHLVNLAEILLGLWLVLLVTAVLAGARQLALARRAGAQMAARLRENEIRLAMPGGLVLKGGSAGLAFCLNTLASINRAYPETNARSWIWSTFFRKMTATHSRWAATGVITADGLVKPVVLKAKLEACAQNPRIDHILIPRQRNTLAAPSSQTHPLKLHACRDLTEAVMKVGRIASGPQVALNLLGVVCSLLMCAAVPNILCILFPPPPPVAVAPSSPSPYFLWVSLDTKHPEFFQVALESGMWVNRHANVERYNSAPASTRAEIRLIRVVNTDHVDLNQGTVWIERRPYFLGREFAPGDRVGLYSVSYLNRLGYE